MNYRTTTDDYLTRARQQLDSGGMAGIFYAAFELRCGIESRMFRYLEARQNITKLKKKGWRIAKMANQIEGTFNTKGKICVITLLGPPGKFPVSEFRYIPISDKLKKMAKKLGDYLHAQETYRSNDDIWWAETRTYMEAVYKELEYVSSGTLMGAPLLNPKNNNVSMQIEFSSEEQEKLEIVHYSLQENKEINIKVDYVKREE